MNRNALSVAARQTRRPATSTYACVRLAQQAHPGAVQQSITQGYQKTQQIKTHVRVKVANRHALNRYTSYTHLLQHALSTADFSRLATVLTRVLHDHVRLGRPTGVSDGLLDECAWRVFCRVLEGGEQQWGMLVEIGWRLRRLGVVWPALGMAEAERREDWKEYGRWAVVLRWHKQDAGAVGRLVRGKLIGRRLLGDLFDCAEMAGMDAQLAATFYCAGLAAHGEVADKIAQQLVTQHTLILESPELRTSSRALAALAHAHVLQGDHARLTKCLSFFAPATATSGWPLGALAQAISTMHSQGDTTGSLRVLAAVACTDHTQFVCVLGALPVLRQRLVRVAMLDDELLIRGTHKHVPLTRFFAPRVFLHLNDPLVRHSVHAYCSRDTVEHRGFARRVQEAGMLAYRLRSPEPVLWLLQNSAKVESRQQAAEQLEALAKVTSEYWMQEHVRVFAENRRSREPYGLTLGQCQGFRTMVLRIYLRLGVEPTTSALAALYESAPHPCWHLAAFVMRQIPYSAVPDHLSFFATLLQRLACKHPAMHLRLYRHLVTHPMMPEPRRVTLTTDMLAQHLGHGHFPGLRYFRLERTLVG
ncbi:hypothetical protein IW150_000715, partial [Coemansia sp. RSA 2607]